MGRTCVPGTRPLLCLLCHKTLRPFGSVRVSWGCLHFAPYFGLLVSWWWGGGVMEVMVMAGDGEGG